MSRRRSTLMSTQEKVAKSLAGEDLTLTFTAARPMVDIVSKHIKLPPIPDEVKPETEIKVRAWTDHESAHIRFSSEPWTIELFKDKVLRKLAFGFEDIRVDRKNGEKFPGTLDNRRKMFDVVRPELGAENILQAALWSIYEVTKGYYDVDPSAEYWAGVLGEPQAAPTIALMMNLVEDQIKRIRVAETQAEIIDLSREVKEIWHKLFKQGGESGQGEGESDDPDNKMSDGGMFGEKQEQSEDQQQQGNGPSNGQGEGQDQSDQSSGEGDGNSSGGGSSEQSDDDLDNIPEDVVDGEGDGEESEDGEESDSEDGEESEDKSKGSGDGDDDAEGKSDGEDSDEESDDDADGASGDEESEDDADEESDCNGKSKGNGSGDKSDDDVDREMDDMVDGMDDMGEKEKDQLEKDLNGGGEDGDASHHVTDLADDLDAPVNFTAWTGDDVIEDIEIHPDGLMKFDDNGYPVRNGTGWGHLTVSQQEFKQDVKTKIGTLQRRLMLDLQSRRRMWVKDRTRGVVDDTRLDRVGTGDGRVFKRKLRRPDLNIAVTTLLDCSSSMFGHKMYLCGQIGYIIAETMASLGVAHEALGFTSISSSGPNLPYGVDYSRKSRLRQIIIKPFEMVKRPQMLERFYSAAQFQGCGTPMGEPVIWAAKRLAQRQEARKVLIVICDGEPCGGGWGDASWEIFQRHTKRAVKRVEASGIETIGIGIATETISQFFDKSVNYEGVESLLTEFYKEFSKVLRGHKNRQERPMVTS